MTIEPAITVFRVDRPGIRKVPGDLEVDLMELTWTLPDQQNTMMRDVG